MSAYKVTIITTISNYYCGLCKTSIDATNVQYFGVLPILQHYSWEGFANTSLITIAGVLIVAFQHLVLNIIILVEIVINVNYEISGWKRSGGGCASPPHQNYSDLQEREVPGEGLQRPDQRSQGQGPEGEGTSQDANQGLENHNQKDSLRRRFQDLGQVPDEDPQESD